jgi:hypothetical protein
MNEKKSKRLRQLVRHLQQRGAIEEQSWLKYASYPEMSTRAFINSSGKLDQMPWMKGQAVMDPGCGRAIYQRMKKNAEHNGKIL